MENTTIRSGLAAALVALLLVAGTAHARKTIRIDGSSDKSVEQSFNRMMKSLDDDGRTALMTAIIQLNLVGVSGAAEMLADPALRNPGPARIKTRIAGLSASEIVALARKTATTRVVIAGQEPGVPEDLLTPLAAGDPAYPLESSRWQVTSDINGHISEKTVEFKSGGELETRPPSTAGASAWEQSADEVRVFINDRYSVSRGRFVDADHMRGTAGNKMGSTWSWTATRQ